jgi:hypothetical protein
MFSRNKYLMLLVVIVSLSAAHQPAVAQCTAKQGVTVQTSTWQPRIQASMNSDLRNNYKNKKCTITKGVHGGGTIPLCAGSVKNHITVQGSGGYTYHVFGRQSPVNNRWCTSTGPPD